MKQRLSTYLRQLEAEGDNLCDRCVQPQALPECRSPLHRLTKGAGPAEGHGPGLSVVGVGGVHDRGTLVSAEPTEAILCGYWYFSNDTFAGVRSSASKRQAARRSVNGSQPSRHN